MRVADFTGIALAASYSFALACSSGAGNSGAGAATGHADSGGATPAASGDGGDPSQAVVDAASDDDAADASSCASYTGAVDSYGADLQKAGAAGQIQFVLMNAQPAPPAKGDNTWTLKLLDATGAPIQGATLAIKTWMPMMRHGSSIAPRQTANSDATYDISNLYLIMDGIWQVTFTVQSGSMKDTATYTFCVGG